MTAADPTPEAASLDTASPRLPKPIPTGPTPEAASLDTASPRLPKPIPTDPTPEAASPDTADPRLPQSDADGPSDGAGPAVERLAQVMTALRAGCPWDAEQTHRSLVPYLIEETAEAVEAIEDGDDAAMREELGDLLLQIVFHAELGRERSAFTLADLADGVAGKLVARHPYVFADAAVPADPMASWERRKKVEKARASAVDGIPEPLSALARAGKVIARARHHQVPVDLPGAGRQTPAAGDGPLDDAAVGEGLLAWTARAQAAGVDADQALRAAVRRLEEQVRAAEAGPGADDRRTARPPTAKP